MKTCRAGCLTQEVKASKQLRQLTDSRLSLVMELYHTSSDDNSKTLVRQTLSRAMATRRQIQCWIQLTIDYQGVGLCSQDKRHITTSHFNLKSNSSNRQTKRRWHRIRAFKSCTVTKSSSRLPNSILVRAAVMHCSQPPCANLRLMAVMSFSFPKTVKSHSLLPQAKVVFHLRSERTVWISSAVLPVQPLKTSSSSLESPQVDLASRTGHETRLIQWPNWQTKWTSTNSFPHFRKPTLRPIRTRMLLRIRGL